jgi:hypothetical protein
MAKKILKGIWFFIHHIFKICALIAIMIGSFKALTGFLLDLSDLPNVWFLIVKIILMAGWVYLLARAYMWLFSDELQ